jgi:predicted ATPase/DNA-binding CsgD family transcriptional regulator
MTETRRKSQSAHSELVYTHGSTLAQIVGRQQELALVTNHYETAREEHTCVVMITGEPGIGKTCLLDEVARRATQDGAVVLRGNASEAEGMPPFLPFLEALGWYIRVTPDDQLRLEVATVPQVLATLLPELTAYLQTSLPVPPEQMRLRLYEAIGIFLEAISITHPLILIFDDLHWADSASLDLLCYLAHRRSHARLLFLGSYREGDAERNDALMYALTELSHQRLLLSIALGPLSMLELAMLIIRKYGSSLSPEVEHLLHTQSEGNPFFAEELFAGWVDNGTVLLEEQQWIAITSFKVPLPQTIVSALRQRFARLDPALIDSLRVAAIIGRSFTLTLLAIVEDREIEAMEDCLLAAVQVRLIRQDAPGCFFFVHDKIRECLYSEVSSSRRRRLHERIGRELEAACGQNMGAQHIAELAFHFAHSNDRAKGIHYGLHAARQAMQTAAFEEAIAHYRTVIELLDPALALNNQDCVARARHLLKKALALFEELQMLASADHTRQRLQALSPPQSMSIIKAEPLAPQTPKRAATLPCRLTVREVEVLKLVVSGKSNCQIAQELVISEKTVINHLTHIFNKTNCENRAAATAFAFRHGLA